MRQTGRPQRRSSCPSPSSWQGCSTSACSVQRILRKWCCLGELCPGPAASAQWLAAFLPSSQVGWPGESRWQVGLTVEDSPPLGAPQVGGLPDVVPEGTLLNMVLRRMHRPRSCSYQLLLEHQRPSRIQGLRWVSAHHPPRLGARAGEVGGREMWIGSTGVLEAAQLALGV